MFPVTVCSSDITLTRITRRRTKRSVTGDSYQPTEPCISSLVGFCLCGWPSPLGRVSTQIGKTGLSCQQYCHLCQYLWWCRLPTLWADHQQQSPPPTSAAATWTWAALQSTFYVSEEASTTSCSELLNSKIKITWSVCCIETDFYIFLTTHPFYVNLIAFCLSFY